MLNSRGETRGAGVRSVRNSEGGVMFENKTKVLLIVPQDVLDRARGLAGEATTTLKLPVSMQIVLRALIEEGLNRDGDRKLFANIEGQARAVRRIRSQARRKEDSNGDRGHLELGIAKGMSGPEGLRRRT
jgi:hypothetical protein